jgi:hypothetical protein
MEGFALMAVAPFRPILTTIGGTDPGSAAAASFRQIEDNFKKWTLHMTGQSGEVLRMALQPTLEKAIGYCPMKTGALRASAYLEVARTGFLGSYQAELGFGRNGEPSYAILVHEVDRYHKPPTRWKFLQTALEEDASEIQNRLVNGFQVASGT